MSAIPKCPRCRGDMEAGFIPGFGGPNAALQRWVAGEPESSILGVKIRGKEQYYVVTFRCKNCGYLESYAPSNAPSV